MTNHALGSVAVVGLGHVGIHYATHLMEAGAKVHAYDTDANRLSEAVANGASGGSGST